MSALDEQLAFLRACGAPGASHSASSLLEHLIGTRELLVSWGAEPEVCTAGLFHSIYGTESFGALAVEIPDRDSVRALVGERCEWLVHTFSSMSPESLEAALDGGPVHALRDRETGGAIEVTRRDLADLCNISAANWLEQRDRLGEAYADLGRERYSRMLPFVLPGARVELSEAYGFV